MTGPAISHSPSAADIKDGSVHAGLDASLGDLRERHKGMVQ